MGGFHGNGHGVFFVKAEIYYGNIICPKGVARIHHAEMPTEDILEDLEV